MIIIQNEVAIFVPLQCVLLL